MKPERKTLDRALSRAGVMSRKQAEQAIRDGRVRVNGLRERDPAFWVDLSRDDVRVDEQPLARWQPLYLALHKPAGLVTSREDERGRETVYELLKNVPAWVAPVGRLDKETSGLLLFTNDTDLAEHVTNPASAEALDDVSGFEWRNPLDVSADELAFPSMKAALAVLQSRLRTPKA